MNRHNCQSPDHFSLPNPNKQNWSILSLVTNKHVISDAEYGSFYVNKKNSTGSCNFGESVEIKFSSDDWIFHPENDIDLAVIPIYQLLEKYLRYPFFPCSSM